MVVVHQEILGQDFDEQDEMEDAEHLCESTVGTMMCDANGIPESHSHL